MTITQENFIESLLTKKYAPSDSLVQAFKSGMELSTKDASKLINCLLNCKNKEQSTNSLDRLVKLTKEVLYKTIKNKRSKKKRKIIRRVK